MELFVGCLVLSCWLDSLHSWCDRCLRRRTGVRTVTEVIQPRSLALGLHAQVLRQRVVLMGRGLHTSQLERLGSHKEGVKTVGGDGDISSVDVVDYGDKILIADVW